MSKNKKTQTKQKPKNGPTSRKRKEPFWLWAGLGISLILGVGAYFYYKPPDSLSASSSPAQIKSGEQLFATNCLICHGPGAIGENPRQSRGGEKPDGSYLAPALNGTGHAWHHPDEILFKTVKDGSIAKDSPMRGFKDKLSDEEIVAVLQYVKSLWPEQIRVRHAMRSQ